jgi:hypothetical protein
LPVVRCRWFAGGLLVCRLRMTPVSSPAAASPQHAC